MRCCGLHAVTQFVSRGGHVSHKLIVVDQAVAVLVRILDHLLYVFLAQLLAQLLHHVSKLVTIDCTVSIFIKHGETLLELLLLLV